MNTKLSRVLACAVGGSSIGYAAQQGYQAFAKEGEPWRVLGYLSVFVTTVFAILGMVALMAMITRRAGLRAKPGSPEPIR